MAEILESITLQHEGFDITVEMQADPDNTPLDADCYTADQVEDWRNDGWQYVGFVYTASRAGVTLGVASIWGTELDIEGGTIGGIADWIREDYYHPDMLGECVADARSTLALLLGMDAVSK